MGGGGVEEREGSRIGGEGNCGEGNWRGGGEVKKVERRRRREEEKESGRRGVESWNFIDMENINFILYLLKCV